MVRFAIRGLTLETSIVDKRPATPETVFAEIRFIFVIPQQLRKLKGLNFLDTTVGPTVRYVIPAVLTPFPYVPIAFLQSEGIRNALMRIARGIIVAIIGVPY